MDYHKLKRKELQALCKEHNIPANSANSVLADKLSELLNEKQKPELKRQAKKVRFSPDNDLVEFEQLQSAEKQKGTVRETRSRRQSLAKQAESVESVNDSTEKPARRTRSSKVDVVPSNEEKQGRRVAKDAEKEVDIEKDNKGNAGKVTRSTAQTSQKGGGEQSKEIKQSRRVVKIVEKESEPVKEAVVGRARVTRSKAQTVEGSVVPEVNTRGKKKGDKQIEADGQSDEADKGTVDVPVRATRSSRQTVKEDMVGNSQVDKKRTRRQMKATDLSSNSSQTAPVDKQEPTKRKSPRTRVVETVDGDEDGKVEVVTGSRATRSKAPVVMEGSGRNGKNKPNTVEIQQVEEPLKHAGKRNVNRRKSVFPPEKIEADVDLDEPVNLPVGKNTRRKSVLPKATKKVASPVRKNLSKAQSGKEATSESPKLKKGKGTLIIKDPVIEDGHGSSVVKSPKSSARSTSKSAGKPIVTKASKKVQSPVVKKQSKAQSGKEATSESPKSRKRKGTPITEDLIIETDFSSPAVKSPTGSARSTSKSAGKSGKFILDPAANTAPGRITRSGFKHGGDTAGSFLDRSGKKKQKSQSAYKKQPRDDAQMAVPEAAEVGPDLGDGTTGVRSAVKQLLDETHMSTPEVEEVQPNPDMDPVGIPGSESVMLPTKVAEENRVSVSEPSVIMEIASLVSGENASEEIKEDSGAPVEKLSNEESSSPRLTEDFVSGNQQDPTELHVFNDETSLGENPSHFDMPTVSEKDVVENVPVPVSDVSNLQDQSEEVYVESGTFSESLNLGTPVIKSGRPDTEEKEMERTESGSSLKRLQTDGLVEEPLVSASKSDGEDGSFESFREQEMDSVAQPFCTVTDDSMLSGRDGEDEAVTVNVEPESSPDALDTPLVSMQAEPISEPPANDGIETLSGNDMSGNPLMEEGDVPDDGINEPKELGTGSEQSTSNKSFDVPEEDDVEGDDPELAQNESVPLLAEVLVRSGDQEREQMANVAADDVPFATSGNDDITVRVDALEQSAADISKDVVSSILGDTYEIDAEDDSGSEQIVTKSDGGFQPKESGGAAPDMIDEQLTEQANDRTLDDQDHAAETRDLDLDDEKSVEDGSNIVGNVNDAVREQASPVLYTKEDSSQPVGDIDARESHTKNESLSFTYEKEERPVEGTDSDLPTMTEDGRPMQEETENAGASLDWGGSDFEMDDFEKPESGNISADISNEGKKSEPESDFQNFPTASSFMEESSGPAAGVETPVRKLEKDSNKVDMLGESANTGADGSFLATPATKRISERDAQVDADAFADQDTYSSRKPSVTTPGVTQLRHVKDAREDAAGSASQDYYSSMKLLLKMPAATRTSHAHDGQEKSVTFADQDLYSSLKTSVTTPATTKVSLVKGAHEDATVSASQDYYSSLKPMFTTPAASQISHIKNSRDDATVNEDPYSSLKPMFTTPGTTQISHMKNSREDATVSVHEDPYSSLKTMFTTPATQISHFKNSQEDASASVIEDPCEPQGSMERVSEDYHLNLDEDTDAQFDFKGETHATAEHVSNNEMYGVQSYEYYNFNLNEDTGTQVDPTKEFDFTSEGPEISHGGTEVDPTKEIDFTSEGPETSPGDFSGLKDNSIHSSELEKKEDPPMKKSEPNDDLAFSTGGAGTSGYSNE